MAPGRISLGGLVAGAACVALAVTGCGGGSSSAPGTAGSTSATAPAKTTTTADNGSPGATAGTTDGKAGKAAEGKARQEAKPGKSQGEGDSGKKYEKKHPPLELPEGPPEPKITKAQKERVPTADLAVTVPGGLTAGNSCKGKNLSPAISWGNLPADTAEVAIFATGVKPVNGGLGYVWALAGVDPSLTGLKAGEVPQGAILGRSVAGKNGYSLCPEGSEPETYVFAVYAIPKSLSPKQGFEPVAVRKQASRASDEVGISAVTFSG